MALDVTPARRMFFLPISWPAIFAALAVGIAVQMLLVLGGLATGIAIVQPVEDAARNLSLAATGWSVASMVVAALVAGYVAARASGLRRKGDGMLHGAVAWAAMTLIYAVLAATVLGAATAGVFGALRPLMAPEAAGSERTQVNQATAQQLEELQQSLEASGLDATQASRMVAELAAAAADAQMAADTQARAVREADRVETTIGWLSAAVLMSLIAGIAGGLAGTAGQQRVKRHAEMSFSETRGLTRSF